MIADSAKRVSEQTDPCVNEQIRRQTEKNLAYFQNHHEEIGERLGQLDREWDIERMLQTGSTAMTLAGLTLGIARNRKWLLLSLAVQGFMMQHALQGWCPPLPVLRRLGFRTQYEIEQERYGLKALRGDYRHVEGDKVERRSSEQVMHALTH